jgi:hypothetical protein
MFYCPEAEGAGEFSPGVYPISANVIKASPGECILSQGDRMIVARHEVPGAIWKIAPSQRDG